MALRFFLSAIATLLLFLLFLGLGRAASRLLGIREHRGAFWMLVHTGMGFGIVGNLVMSVCFAQRAGSGTILGMLVALAAISLPFLRQPLTDLSGIINKLPALFRRHPLLAGSCSVMLSGYFAVGLFPPADFDALMYHLSIPNLYLREGGFWNIFFNAQSDYPMLTEMVYMIGLAAGNDHICRTLSFGISALLTGAIAHLCRQYLRCDSRQTLIAVLIFCTSTSVIAGFTACNVDMAQALWTLIAVLLLERYIADRSSGMLLLCAFFAGLAMETKIFGVFVLPVLMVRLGIVAIRQDTGAKPLRTALVMFLPCFVLLVVPLIMTLPWYLKALHFKGTILSVYHSSIQGQGLANPMNLEISSSVLAAYVNIPLRLIAAPWTFSLFPGQHQGDTFGPLFIAILPLLLLTGVPHRARFLLIAGGMYWAAVLFLEMWFVQGGSSIRYSTFIIAIGAAFIPWIVSRLSCRPFLGRMTAVMVATMIALGMTLFVKRYHREWVALLTNASREVYYTAVLAEYPVIKKVNAISDGKKVMPIYNYTDYLIDVPYITAYRNYTSAAEMRADLLDKNIGYIFANDKFDTAANRDPFPELPEKTCIAAENGFALFRLDLDAGSK